MAGPSFSFGRAEGPSENSQSARTVLRSARRFHFAWQGRHFRSTGPRDPARRLHFARQGVTLARHDRWILLSFGSKNSKSDRTVCSKGTRGITFAQQGRGILARRLHLAPQGRRI